MSVTKRRYEEYLEREFEPTGKQVCGECVGDTALRRLVRDEAEEVACDYCGVGPAAPLDAVLEHALEALRAEYRPASEESPPWEGREGGYQAPEFYLPDLIFDNLETGFASAVLYDDIVLAVAGYLEPWFEREWYALRPHQQLVVSWRRFEAVTMRRRDEQLRPRARLSRDPDEWVEPAEMLDQVAEAIARLPRLYQPLPVGTGLWRARYGTRQGHRTAAALGPPGPAVPGVAGRMSRADQKWFYGATDRETAVIEKYSSREHRPLSVGRFTTLRPLMALDLTGANLDVPGIYDIERHAQRFAAIFLHQFAAEIAKPVRRGGSPRYIPTQLMTDYVRRELGSVTGTTADGIAFPSSRHPGVNVVLFLGAESVTDLGGVERPGAALGLDKGSTEVVSAAEVRRTWRSRSPVVLHPSWPR